MDTRTARKPLEDERSALLESLANSKPRHLEKLEAELVVTRGRRAVLAGKFQALCQEAHYAPSQKPTPEIAALEGELATINAAWEPNIARATKPVLDATLPALLHAVTLIEASAEVFAEYDRHIRANGLGVWRVSQSRRLSDVAATLRRFCQGWAQK